MSNLFMSYLHIPKVGARKKKKCIQSSRRKKNLCNRYWLQIYSNWVKKNFPPAAKAAKKTFFLNPFFLLNHDWDGSWTANDKMKIDPNEFMVEKLLNDL